MSYIDEYKLRALRLMKNLHAISHNLYDQNVLDFLLPLLSSTNVSLIDSDFDLLYKAIGFFECRLELFEYDTSTRIVYRAIHTDLVSILSSLVKHKNESISTVSTLRASNR